MRNLKEIANSIETSVELLSEIQKVNGFTTEKNLLNFLELISTDQMLVNYANWAMDRIVGDKELFIYGKKFTAASLRFVTRLF